MVLLVRRNNAQENNGLLSVVLISSKPTQVVKRLVTDVRKHRREIAVSTGLHRRLTMKTSHDHDFMEVSDFDL